MSEGVGTAASPSGGPAAAIARPDPGEGETPHAFLRRVTRPWHDGVEAAFVRFDLATREGLSEFLMRQAAALLPLERSMECGGVAALLPDWPARRRGPALRADLAGLGLEAPSPGDLPGHTTPFHMLGALYVLEGSKLGGRVLHRRVLASPDPEMRAATAFLGHRQERGWPAFLAVLDGVPPSPQAWAGLREGAWAAFAAFDAAARCDIAARFTGAPSPSGLYDRGDA